MEFITNTWHWSISGFLIGVVMLLLTYFGKTFGMSSNLRTICSMSGGNKTASYFNFDWREQKWNLAIVLGSIVGGFIAYHFLGNASNIDINPKTIAQLQHIGIDAPNGKLLQNAVLSGYALTIPNAFFLLCIIWFLDIV